MFNNYIKTKVLNNLYVTHLQTNSPRNTWWARWTSITLEAEQDGNKTPIQTHYMFILFLCNFISHIIPLTAAEIFMSHHKLTFSPSFPGSPLSPLCPVWPYVSKNTQNSIQTWGNVLWGRGVTWSDSQGTYWSAYHSNQFKKRSCDRNYIHLESWHPRRTRGTRGTDCRTLQMTGTKQWGLSLLSSRCSHRCVIENLPEGHRWDHEEYQEDPDRRRNYTTEMFY